MNYYNEFDKFAANWLRELIKEGLIPDGRVDERDMRDVKPSDLDGFTSCHFFAGIGGWAYALRLAGWPDDRPVWTGSCPCQPFSAAGQGKGTDDDRHLWPAFRWLIANAKRTPSVIFGEQVASKAGREWLSGVRLDLEAMGYAVGAADLCAAGIGAPHIRQRLWWVVHSKAKRLEGRTPQRWEKQDRTRWDEIWSESGRTGASNTDCGVADSQRERSQGRIRWREDTQRENINGHTGCCGPTNHWQNSIPIPCADGKWRRVPGRVANARRIQRSEKRGQQSASEVLGEKWTANTPSPSSEKQPGRVAESRRGGVQHIGTMGKLDEEKKQKQLNRRNAVGHIGKDDKEGTNHLEVEPLLFPLVDGLRDRMGDMWDDGILEALSCFPLSDGIPGRVGLLRGAGNAIVPQLASEFIKYYLETKNG
jgi:DNA (cytosine-5)-methyltransferase 1